MKKQESPEQLLLVSFQTTGQEVAVSVAWPVVPAIFI